MTATDSQVGAELPRYRCHKEVWAVKIKAIDRQGLTITPEESVFAPIPVTNDYFHRHNPQVGGYYVVYGDGYVSFSPAKAFEDGYTRI